MIRFLVADHWIGRSGLSLSLFFSSSFCFCNDERIAQGNYLLDELKWIFLLFWIKLLIATSQNYYGRPFEYFPVRFEMRRRMDLTGSNWNWNRYLWRESILVANEQSLLLGYLEFNGARMTTNEYIKHSQPKNDAHSRLHPQFPFACLIRIRIRVLKQYRIGPNSDSDMLHKKYLSKTKESVLRPQCFSFCSYYFYFCYICLFDVIHIHLLYT